MNETQPAAEWLSQLGAEALAAEATDQDLIVRIGTALEGLLEPGDLSEELQGLLSLVLEALQQVYRKAAADPAAVLNGIAGALCAASEHLAGPEGRHAGPTVAHAAETLRQALDASFAPVLTATPDVVPDPKPETLSALAAPPSVANQPAAGASLAASAGVPVTSSTYFQTPAVLPADTDVDLLKEFVVECLDHISAAESSLLDLEVNPDGAELINTVFRAFHTIKGTSGFLGLDRIQKLAHLAESLLDRARNGQIKIRGGYADLALKSCDTLRTMIEALREAQPGQSLAIPSHLEDLLAELAAPESHGISDESQLQGLRVGDILVGQGIASRETVEDVVQSKGNQKTGQALVESGVAAAQEVASALRTQKKLEGADADSTIRVGTARLDSLINMVGELVIAQSMVAQDRTVAGAADLSRKVTHANKIVRELQDLGMSLRMVPLRATFQKMARLVRDLGRKSGKNVQFVSEGEDTEIDRSMVEVLGDPLVHMIRNSMDHGIESAEDRVKAGKAPAGTVTLRAYHAAGEVVIELRDDGRGLNKEKILAKALEKGLVVKGQEMTEGEIFALIFQPGFSTADKVTDISGRGVGMDVVRKGIDSLRGQIDVRSTPGQGTTFSLRLPLTMAISDSMLVRVGDHKYLLPTISVEHSFRPGAGQVFTVGGQGEMVQLRGQLLPMFRLHRLFSIPGAVDEPDKALLIVLEGHGQRCALMVDELLGQQQVVIKSLGSTFANVPGVAGGAILGDGRVGLILDPTGIVELSHRQNSQDSASAA